MSLHATFSAAHPGSSKSANTRASFILFRSPSADSHSRPPGAGSPQHGQRNGSQPDKTTTECGHDDFDTRYGILSQLVNLKLTLPSSCRPIRCVSSSSPHGPCSSDGPQVVQQSLPPYTAAEKREEPQRDKTAEDSQGAERSSDSSPVVSQR